MKKNAGRVFWGLLAALLPLSSYGEYSYFYTSTGGSLSGSDGIVKEMRWPYWNSYYYNTWINDNWTSSDGVSGYFYNGLALPAAGSPSPVGTRQTVNWSFWPLSNPINITDTISSVYTSPNTFSMQTIGEGTIFRAPGLWSLWQTNVWYKMAIRTWQPVNNAPHLGYAGTWMRDPVAGVWYHMATIKLPMAVTGVTGSDGFQENASGGTQPQRTDYRNCYYHRSGTWNPASRFQVYNHAGAVENAGLIETNSAVYYETCENNASYTGTITNVGQYSPVFTIANQPATPAFDPILVTNYSTVFSGSQVLVQWQIPATSSPQFAYRLDVYTNADYTGAIVTNFYDIDPEARQKLLDVGTSVTPYVKLTIIDIFNQTNAPVSLASSNVLLKPVSPVTGTQAGLNFSYYQSASNIYNDGSGSNWSNMPNFSVLSPLSKGAVSGLDLTPRKRRNGYAFNYTGYINVPTDGIYTFTLNSDAGSKLYVDSQLIVNWDGEHSPSDLSGWTALQAGLHIFNVQYFCDAQPTALFSEYFDTLTLSYEGPGIAKTIVPAGAYFRVPNPGEPTISLTSPTNGTTIPVAGVPLSASVTANGATINNVQYYVGNHFWSQTTTPPYSANSFFWADNNNPVRARIFYNSTNILDSGVNLVTTTNTALAPWQFGQIFYHNTPSGAAIQNGTYSVIGDGMNLLSRQVNGDCTLIAHLAGLPSTAAAPDGSTPNSGWQAGIILRGNTNMIPGYPWGISGNAPFTAVFGQVDGGAYYQDESMVNGGGGYASGNLGGQKWFKLQRAGNVFTSSVSADGATWRAVKTNTLTDFPATIYVGFFTYAGPSSNPNVPWAGFDNVSITGNLVGPPGVVVSPAADTAFAGQNITFNASPTGNAPFFYQWQYNGINLPGATNAVLVLTNLQVYNSGIYSMTLSNASGTATAAATLRVLTPLPVSSQILSNQPTGYWRLNETAGPTAHDALGTLDGAGEGGIIFGVPGVTNAPFNGFETNHLAALFNGIDADVSIPGFNYATTNFTLTGWVRCDGAQTSWSGLVFSRSSGYGTGLMLDNNGSNVELRYSWNDNGGDYNFSTHLNLPTNGVWAFVALTIEQNRAIVYMATNNVLYSATNNVVNNGRAFSGNFYFGYDPNSSSRRLIGALDEIAIYGHTLSYQQISQIVSAAGQTAPAINLLTPVTGASYASPATINLAANVSTNGHVIGTLQFFNGTNWLGNADAGGTYTWTNVPAGNYTLFASASYDGGSPVSSAPALISVNPVPLTPGAPVAAALASNLAAITWPVTTYATSYSLFRNGNFLATLTGTNYQDIGLVANSNYCYSVVANNSYGSSAASDTACLTTPTTGLALQWDAGGSMTGAQDGNGNWGTGVLTWWNGSANVIWTDNAVAIFGAGTSTNCIAIITSSVTPGSLIFNANNGGSYTLSSSGSGQLVLAGTPAITANADVNLSAPLSGGGLIKSGAGTLTISGGNANTGTIIVNGGKLVSTGGGWYANRSIGAGALTVSNGAGAEFTQAHGFGVGAEGRAATLNGGTLQFDHENYVSSVTLTAGIINGTGEIRTTGGIYNSLAASSPSLISLPVNFASSGIFLIARGTATVDLQASGSAYNTGNFTKSGAGIMAISGTWTNSGTTTISAGRLQLDGGLGTNSMTVQNTATLSGNGTLGGATTVQSGGALNPGDNAIGTLTISNKLTLNAGSKTTMELSKSNQTLTNDWVKGVTTLTYGGTLVATNIGSAMFAPGDTFTLFSAATYTGSFASFTLPALGAGLAWDTSKLPMNGRISVYTAAQPAITNTTAIANGNFSLSGQGAAGQAYVLLMASNLVAPMTWTPMFTNIADTNGNFNFSDPQAGNSLQRFYRIQQAQ